VGGPVFFALAVLVALGTAALAWSQVRRTAALAGGDRAALALALKRFPAPERAGELLRRAEPGSWEHDLATEVLATPDERARVAAVNLALIELDHALSEGAAWPRSATRIALLGGALLAFGAFLADGGQLEWSVFIVAVGVAAAATCSAAARSATRNAAAQRRSVDDLIVATFGRALVGDVAGRSREPRSRRRS
jgi:hypothetical protein